MKEDQVMTSLCEAVLLPGTYREFLPAVYFIGSFIATVQALHKLLLAAATTALF